MGFFLYSIGAKHELIEITLKTGFKAATIAPLVDCFNHKLPSLDGVDDAVGISGPDEGFWVSIGLGDEAFDRRLEINDRMEHTSLEAPSGELGEEALDRVEPGARGLPGMGDGATRMAGAQ